MASQACGLTGGTGLTLANSTFNTKADLTGKTLLLPAFCIDPLAGHVGKTAGVEFKLTELTSASIGAERYKALQYLFGYGATDNMTDRTYWVTGEKVQAVWNLMYAGDSNGKYKGAYASGGVWYNFLYHKVGTGNQTQQLIAECSDTYRSMFSDENDIPSIESWKAEHTEAEWLELIDAIDQKAQKLYNQALEYANSGTSSDIPFKYTGAKIDNNSSFSKSGGSVIGPFTRSDDSSYVEYFECSDGTSTTIFSNKIEGATPFQYCWRDEHANAYLYGTTLPKDSDTRYARTFYLIPASSTKFTSASITCFVEDYSGIRIYKATPQTAITCQTLVVGDGDPHTTTITLTTDPIPEPTPIDISVNLTKNTDGVFSDETVVAGANFKVEVRIYDKIHDDNQQGCGKPNV